MCVSSILSSIDFSLNPFLSRQRPGRRRNVGCVVVDVNTRSLTDDEGKVKGL